MPVRLFYLFHLVFYLAVLGLQAKDSKSFVKNPVQHYYELIHMAEKSICGHAHEEAIQFYKSAFALIDSPFPEDIYNCILLYIYEGEYKQALLWGEQLVRMGAELSFFDQIPLNKLKDDKKNWQNFINKYPELRTHYQLNTNFILKRELIALLEADQYNYCGQQIRPFNPISEDSICTRLAEIILEFGYPNHDIQGLTIRNDTILDNFPQDIVLIHLFQTKNKQAKKIADQLKSDVYNGKIKPENAISFLEIFHEPYSFYGIKKFEIRKGKVWFRNFDFELCNYEMFEINRADLWAPVLTDALKKNHYKINNPETKFLFRSMGVELFLANDFIGSGETVLFEKEFLRLNTAFDAESLNFNSTLPKPDMKHNFENPERNDSIYKYHFLVNQAELKISELDFEHSLSLYKRAFKLMKQPFPKDVFNSILCCIYTKHYDNAFKYSDLLIGYGVDLRFFNQYPFEQLKLQIKSWQKFSASVPEKISKFQKGDKYKLQKEIDSIHNKFFSGKHYIQPKEENFYEIIKFIKNYGYPNHKTIGAKTTADGLRLIAPETLLTLYFQTMTEKKEISDILLSEVFCGNITPVEFLNIDKYDYKYGTPVIAKYKEAEYYVFNVNEENNKIYVKQYDQMRLNSFNCTLEEEIKKRLFLEENKDYSFDFGFERPQKINHEPPYRVTGRYKWISF